MSAFLCGELAQLTGCRLSLFKGMGSTRGNAESGFIRSVDDSVNHFYASVVAPLERNPPPLPLTQSVRFRSRSSARSAAEDCAVHRDDPLVQAGELNAVTADAPIGKRKLRRRGLALPAAVAAVVITASSAWAAEIYNMVPNPRYDRTCEEGSENGGPVCRTDNANWRIWRKGSLESDDKARVHDVLRGEFSPTALAVHFPDSPVYTGSSETDLIFEEGGVPSDLQGITWCDDQAGGTHECDQHYVRIEAGHYSYGLTCHESGHAVGLLHGQDSDPAGTSNTDSRLACMKTPVNSGDRLGSNNKDNINTVY